MTDAPMPESVAEVCEWKERAAVATKGMTREQLINYYRRKGDEFEQKLGLNLVRIPAGERELVEKDHERLRTRRVETPS